MYYSFSNIKGGTAKCLMPPVLWVSTKRQEHESWFDLCVILMITTPYIKMETVSKLFLLVDNVFFKMYWNYDVYPLLKEFVSVFHEFFRAVPSTWTLPAMLVYFSSCSFMQSGSVNCTPALDSALLAPTKTLWELLAKMEWGWLGFLVRLSADLAILSVILMGKQLCLLSTGIEIV